jgi:uncharacterized protein involved in exopolysaccharide biosynthesis
MTAETKAPVSIWRRMWARKWLVIVPILVSTATTLVVSRKLPPRFRSAATIVVMPAQVGSDVVQPISLGTPEERMRNLSQQILSRTRLERIITDLNLFPEERRHGIMEDIIEQFRRNIELEMLGADAFLVSYTGASPQMTMNVTNRLASLFIEESVRDRSNRADATAQFIEAEITQAARAVAALESEVASFAIKNSGKPVPQVLALKYEVAKDNYKSLLTKQTETNIAAQLERRSAGEQFRLIDPARAPSRAIGPGGWQLAVTAAAIGLGVGLLLLVLASLRNGRAVTA